MNPLIESINSELPKFNAIDPENHIKTGLNQKLNLMLTEFDEFEKQVQEEKLNTFDQIIGQLEKMKYPVEYIWGIVNHLNGVSSSDPLREAKFEVQPKLIDAFMK